jgi:hypothetical protein
MNALPQVSPAAGPGGVVLLRIGLKRFGAVSRGDTTAVLKH